MKRLRFFCVFLVCILAAPVPLAAGDFDGSNPLICAVIETFECGQNAECQRGPAESIGIPQFLKIDFAEKIISSPPGAGPVRTTNIRQMESVDGKLILQGVQNGRAWSMVINETSGKVTLSASDDQAGFVVFGACTTP
jgi:hypothetical protein